MLLILSNKAAFPVSPIPPGSNAFSGSKPVSLSNVPDSASNTLNCGIVEPVLSMKIILPFASTLAVAPKTFDNNGRFCFIAVCVAISKVVTCFFSSSSSLPPSPLVVVTGVSSSSGGRSKTCFLVVPRGPVVVSVILPPPHSSGGT